MHKLQEFFRVQEEKNEVYMEEEGVRMEGEGVRMEEEGVHMEEEEVHMEEQKAEEGSIRMKLAVLGQLLGKQGHKIPI